ncbi:MAG: mechanosensitive ion channel family protein [Magnetococcales bacterium]|nr:mechanosensitive ion channel family protein [Magnetococcales bacterium]
MDVQYPPGKVIQIVESSLQQANIATMAQSPAPNCIIMSFESGYNRYAVRYWLTDLQPDDPTDSQVRSHVYAALERAGISLALTQQAMYMVQESSKREKRVRAQQVSQHVEALKRIDLFSPLSQEELHILADKLVYAPYLAGDVITRQGNQAQWLYILESGQVEIYREVSDTQRVVMNTLGPGSIFGEMSLMTGEPRMATVRALTDVSCFRLNKDSFETILLSRPQVVEELTAIMVARQNLLEQSQENTSEEKDGGRRHTEMIQRVRRFFGLDRLSG